MTKPDFTKLCDTIWNVVKFHVTAQDTTFAYENIRQYLEENPAASEIEITGVIMNQFKFNCEKQPMFQMRIPSACDPNVIYVELNDEISRVVHEIMNP